MLAFHPNNHPRLVSEQEMTSHSLDPLEAPLTAEIQSEQKCYSRHGFKYLLVKRYSMLEQQLGKDLYFDHGYDSNTINKLDC